MEIEKAKYPSIGKYLLVQNLGAGFNSKVKLGVHTETNQKVAVKILKDVFNKFITNEIDTLSKINHPNIVNLIEFMGNVDYLKKNGTVKKVSAIVLELAPGGEVFEFLFRTGRFSEGVSRFYFQSMLDSLVYIHKMGYAHRDLKPENLLFGNEFQLKLADFGFSTLHSGKDGKGVLHTYLGTKGYMAPEIIGKQPYVGEAVDVFASGVILFIMYCGIPPFGEAGPNDPYYKLLSTKKYDYFWHAHSRNKPAGFFSVEFKDLIQAMLAFDHKERPTFQDITGHAWFQQVVPSFEAVQKEMEARNVKVQSEMEKERQEKAMIAEKKKAMQQKQGGGVNLMAYPKGKGALENLSQDVFSGLEAEFPALSLERKPVTYDKSNAQTQDFMLPDNVNDALTALLYVLKQSNGADFQISTKAHKVTATVPSDEEKVKLVARIFKNDDATSFVRFERQDGNSIKYLEVVDNLEKELDKVTKVVA